MTFMRHFLAHPLRQFCRLVIYFCWAIWTAECFRRSADLHNLQLRIHEERNAVSAVMSQ